MEGFFLFVFWVVILFGWVVCMFWVFGGGLLGFVVFCFGWVFLSGVWGFFFLVGGGVSSFGESFGSFLVRRISLHLGNFPVLQL